MARADFADRRLMRLGLSSAAAPEATAAELLDVCAARGLATIELRADGARGIDASARGGVTVAGFYSDDSGDAIALAQLATAACVPIIVADAVDIADRIERARRILDEGGLALVLGRGPAGEWLDAVADSGLQLAWEVDARNPELEKDADRVLRERRPLLRYIRFIGSGPESSLNEGNGVGALMGRLALAAYNGPVILAPGSPRFHVAWSAWIGRRGGWGCGSAATGVVPLAVGGLQ